MTKVYTVTPESDVIKVSDATPPREIICGGPIAWGDKLKGYDMARLCRALIADVFDAEIAARLAQRFAYRTVIKWDKSKPNGMTDDQIKIVVADILKAEAEVAPFVDKMQRERPNYVSDNADKNMRQGWTSDPEIKPNVPKEKSNG